MSEETKQNEAQEGVETMEAQAAQDQADMALDDERLADGAEPTHRDMLDLDAVRDRLGQKFDDDVAVALDNLAERAAEIEKIEQELDETREQLMRQAASFQNYRRRTQQEMERVATHARADVIRQLLDVLDDFDRTMDVVQQNEEQDDLDYEQAYASLSEGVGLVYRKLSDELKRLDVEPIEAEGQPFDENLHDAMMQQPAPEGVEEGTADCP